MRSHVLTSISNAVFCSSLLLPVFTVAQNKQDLEPKPETPAMVGDHGTGAILDRPSPERVLAIEENYLRADAFYHFSRKPKPATQDPLRFKPGAAPPPASATDAVFSWKPLGIVSPVTNQGNCGDCYVFAPIAALEANWAKDHQKQIIDASEQHAFNCAPGSCTGGYAYKVMDILTYGSGYVRAGTDSERDEPYVGYQLQCEVNHALPYRGVAWKYVEPHGNVPSSLALKQAIVDHGPVAAFVHAGGEFASHNNTDAVVTQDYGDPPRDNHFILIIGWDDNKQAWEIKNSWGTTWGRGGFGFVRYGIRDIGDNAMFVETAPTLASGSVLPQ